MQQNTGCRYPTKMSKAVCPSLSLLISKQTLQVHLNRLAQVKRTDSASDEFGICKAVRSSKEEAVNVISHRSNKANYHLH